jgi:hypothetical protein
MYRMLTLSTALVLLLLGAPALAQVAPPTVPAPPSQAVPPTELREHVVTGAANKIDPAAKTVQVGGLFGWFGTTLAVTDATQITVNGTTGSFDRIREGDRITAMYEDRAGTHIARAIDVTSTQPQTGRAPGGGGASRPAS